jgi:hypothetical protein
MSTPVSTNPLQKFEQVAAKVGTDIVHGVEDIVHVSEDVLRVLSSAQTLAPAFKTELAQLISDAQPIAAALAPDIASGGTNIAVDLASIGPLLPAIKTLVSHFIQFLPTLKLAVSDVEADVK